MSEPSVLGAVFLDNLALDTARKYLTAGDFSEVRNQRVFETMCELSDRGEPIDLVSVTDSLIKAGEKIDPAYIGTLPDMVPSAGNIEYYAKVVKEKADRRRLLGLGERLREKAMDPTVTSESLREEAERMVYSLGEYGDSEYQKLGQLLTSALTRIEWRQAHPLELSGIPTGLADLDAITDGFQPSELILIGARPSIGKTALALTIATHIAVVKKIPVGVFSLEMSGESVALREFSVEGRLDGQRIRKGALKPADFHSLTEAAGRLYDAPFFIFDQPNARIHQIKSAARKMVKRNGVKIIFIDYAGLITHEDAKKQRHEQISEISRGLKALARELKIPVVLLTQLTRSSEGKRPTLAEIRDSGGLEQDADMVMFLHRERESEVDVIPTELIVAKQRNGPTGTIEILFNTKFTRFDSEEKHYARN